MHESSDNAVIQPLRIGDKAPDFRARTTQGTFTLGELKGRWVMLMSHPASFTPVCTSEFIAMTRAEPDFRQRNCVLLGLSVDSLPSHLAWVDMVYERFGVEINFPIIEDPSLTLSRIYGMLDPTAHDSATARAVRVIDPEGILRASLTYPATVGRSIAELLRLLDALQEVDRHHVLTPEGWQPGQETLAPPVQTQQAMRQRGKTWFLHPVESSSRENR
ncbi:peroxiredoxin [Saccharibacter sp. 17.LH.SD]|uniref:peroxiredoxin n=1 Tax=Saccharibacter sp. 17.LH.SD TaxID=2689393 RepID=UPI0013716F68|nr:peroxiredoxin [Saccharibacter sp. 17.LH.SD]MXV45035.1 peroxiredoxin [Saccharibacter sp. 17.LH.SD]